MPVLETTATEVEDDPDPFLAPLGPSPAQPRRSHRRSRDALGADQTPARPGLCWLCDPERAAWPLWAVVRMNEFTQVSGG